MINFIVFSALALSVLFVGVWLFCPGLRVRIEQPKYEFLEQSCMDDAGHERSGQ